MEVHLRRGVHMWLVKGLETTSKSGDKVTGFWRKCDQDVVIELKHIHAYPSSYQWVPEWLGTETFFLAHWTVSFFTNMKVLFGLLHCDSSLLVPLREDTYR